MLPNAMPCSWERLPKDIRRTLALEAMRRAVDGLATQAERLAEEMEAGRLADRGGPDALRLLAALIRAADGGPDLTRMPPAGHA